ncbi:hypothetical protein PAXRUDRAFT_158028, partial [Paxillus rubicundulus Ve08.2h10]
QSLLVANKATFRNCLVAMHPNTVSADLPLMHNISSFIHNSFINFLHSLKTRIHVSYHLIHQLYY